MRLGMVGLGKMGANMTKRLIEHGHELFVTDLRRRCYQSCGSRGRNRGSKPRRTRRKTRCAACGMGHGALRQTHRKHDYGAARFA